MKNTMNNISVESSIRPLNRIGTYLCKMFFRHTKRRYEEKYASGYYIAEGKMNYIKGYIDLYLIDAFDIAGCTIDCLDKNGGKLISIKEFSERPGIKNMKELGRLL